MYKKIISVKNEHIKDVVRLRDRRYRDKKNLTIVEGVREIERAMDALCDFKEFYVCKETLRDDDEKLFLRIDSLNVPIYDVPENVFKKIAYGDRMDGLLGVCRPRAYRLDDLPCKKDLLLFIVEAVEKPGNLGAMLRTCDASGVDGVVVCDQKTDIFNPNIIRASIGTVFTNKVIVSSSEEIYQYVRAHDLHIYAATPQAKTIYTDISYKGSLAIIVGSEEKGLSPFWMQKANIKIRIPMKGKADSLNVSTSAAILLYEAVRQRHG